MRHLLTFACCCVFAGATLLPGGCSPADPDRPNHDAGSDLSDTSDTPDLSDTSDTSDLSDLPDLSDTSDTPDSSPDADADAGVHVPLVDNSLGAWDWAAQVRATADRDTLAAAFAAAGYTPPAGTRVFAALVADGLEQPAFSYFSRGEEGFEHSYGRYWPASTVKLLAAVGAVRTLRAAGATSAATVAFTDDDGSYDGTVANLVDLAIRVSDNVAYNRLMEIAGFEEQNGLVLSPAFGMPTLVLQRRYTHPTPESDLRHSPAIAWSEGASSGTLPARDGTSVFPECPDEANCVTLAELTEGVRRVGLHEELPAPERFDLGAGDLATLHAALLASPSQFQPGISTALAGHSLRVYNKLGQVYGDDRLDHALIIDDTTGRAFLLAAAMPYNTTTEADLSELARQTLVALLAAPDPRVFLQRDAGPPVLVRTQYVGPGCVEGSVIVSLQIEVSEDTPTVDRVELFMDRWPIESPLPDGRVFRMQRDFSAPGDRLLSVYAYSGDVLVAVRHAAVRVGP